MSELRFGLGLWQAPTFDEATATAQLAEDLGFDTLWYGNHKFYRDMFVALTLLATKTERIQLGTFIAEPYSMHPALIGAAIASVDEISHGRAVLGLGTGGANFKELDLVRRKPAKAMEETVRILRPYLAGERIDFNGEVFSVHDGWLHMPAHPNIPLVIASRGDLVLEGAGRLADGAMLATYATPEGQAHAQERVAAGAAAAGRRLEDIELIIRVDTTIDDDVRVARDSVRPMIASMIMNSYPDAHFVEQVGLELTPELKGLGERKNEAEAFSSGHLVPDEFVRQFAWAGTADDVASQIEPLVQMGFRSITIMPQPMGVDLHPMIREFGTKVMPRLKSTFS